MTPKEKARELVNKYYIHSLKGKECAIIAVDEIFFALKYNLDGATSGSVKYWEKVKEEINKR